MTALEEIKKALESVAVREWTFDGPDDNIIIWCGTDTRVCFMTSDGPSHEHAQFITACSPTAITELLSTLESLQRENEELRNLTADLRLQAQTHAMEARGANATINEIYQIISGGKGEPGNWNGAEPVRKYAEAAEAEVKRLRNKVSARSLTGKQLADEIEAINEACKVGFGEGGGSPGEWWYERADELEHERKRRELESQLQQHNSRTALASTGGEHHAE